MSLKEKMNEDLKSAMKAREKDRVSVLRMILSEVKYAAAAVNVHQELPEEEVLKVVTTYHKRLTKSLEDFPEGDQRQQIRLELAIVEHYLPKKASEDEVRHAVDQVLTSATDQNFGSLMKEVMARLGSAADGKIVSQILKSKMPK